MGDLVLKQTKLGSKRPEGGVFKPNWQGPYYVIVEERVGVFRLQDDEERDLERSFHSVALKIFFV